MLISPMYLWHMSTLGSFLLYKALAFLDPKTHYTLRSLSFLKSSCFKTAHVCCVQKVKERLVCHAIVGAQKGKSLLMYVNIICEFIAPLIQLSTRLLIYRLEKVSGAMLGRPGCSSQSPQAYASMSETKVIGTLLICIPRTVLGFFFY